MPTYNYELADSAHEMFENGFEYLTATDLATYHIKGKSLGREIVSGIEKRLPRIKRILEKEHGLLVHGVNDHFYDLPFLPVTLAEAFKSIPGRGPGQTMSGIRVVNGNGCDLSRWKAGTMSIAATMQSSSGVPPRLNRYGMLLRE